MLNKQSDSIQPWCTPFQFGTSALFHVHCCNCCFLTYTQVSQEAGKVVWYSLLLNFPQFAVIHTIRVFSIVSETEGVLEFSCFFCDPVDVGNLISGSSTFSKSSLNIWKFTVHVPLQPGLENFEHECNCVVVWAFFGIAFLGIGMETDLFQSCGHCWASAALSQHHLLDLK